MKYTILTHSSPVKVDEFKSIKKFKIFNTNNLWVSLKAIERYEKHMHAHTHNCPHAHARHTRPQAVTRSRIRIYFVTVTLTYSPIPLLSHSPTLSPTIIHLCRVVKEGVLEKEVDIIVNHKKMANGQAVIQLESAGECSVRVCMCIFVRPTHTHTHSLTNSRSRHSVLQERQRNQCAEVSYE